MKEEEELYEPIIDLFKDGYFVAAEVPLGPKRIDIVAVSERNEKIIAIEVKINKWKRAFRQALNYQLGADESYVALPQKYSKSIDRERFRASGVGLITVVNGTKAIISIPAKQSPRKSHSYSTLLKAHLAEMKERQKSPNNPSQSSTLPFKLYLWYVATERRYFDDMPDSYDGFIINAHILAHCMSAFTALCTRLNKPFFILPDTHAFQLAPISLFLDAKGGIRTSWEKLAKSYGPLINFVLMQGRKLQPNDFVSKVGSWEQSFYDLVEKVINFQKERVPSTLIGLARFFDEPPVSPPTYLVAPYFFFTSINDPWYEISLQMTRESVKYKEKHKLFAVLCASKNILVSDQAISKIVSDYSFSDLDGILLWIQDFDEEEEPTPLLYGFRKLIRSFKEVGKEVINIHGKFFSCLLYRFGLDGFSTGVCYKEVADPTQFPTGGPPGGPLPKYYLPEIKVKMGKLEAAIAVQQLSSLRCPCEICSKQIDYMLDGATPDAVSKDLMKRHFLLMRRQENEHICKTSLMQVVSEIQGAYNKYKKRADIIPVEHLKRWVEVLKKV